jgi:hypothetical protein
MPDNKALAKFDLSPVACSLYIWPLFFRTVSRGMLSLQIFVCSIGNKEIVADILT